MPIDYRDWIEQEARDWGRMLDEEQRPRFEEVPMTKTWTTRDGRVIPISNMETDHLEKTLKFLLRGAQLIVTAEVGSFLSLPMPTGEAAIDAWESVADKYMDRSVEDILPDVYWDLLAEFEARGCDMDMISRYIDDLQSKALADELKAISKRKVRP